MINRIDPQEQTKLQELANTSREILLSVQSDEEKAVVEKYKSIVNDLNELGLPYLVIAIIPYELERGTVGSLQYNNLSGLAQTITKENEVQMNAVLRAASVKMDTDLIKSVTGTQNESSFTTSFSYFTARMMECYRYLMSSSYQDDQKYLVEFVRGIVFSKKS